MCIKHGVNILDRLACFIVCVLLAQGAPIPLKEEYTSHRVRDANDARVSKKSNEEKNYLIISGCNIVSFMVVFNSYFVHFEVISITSEASYYFVI